MRHDLKNGKSLDEAEKRISLDIPQDDGQKETSSPNIKPFTNATSTPTFSDTFYDISSPVETEEIMATTEKRKPTIAEENDLFLESCRNDGILAKRGMATNFVENPILKKAEKTVNNSTSVIDSSTSFTRNADIIEINTAVLARSSAEDVAALEALTSKKDEVSRFRRKHVDYGNNNAMHEVISQKLYALTGMTSPDTKIMVDKKEVRESGALEISIISPMIVGYKDLGDFLIEGSATRFIAPENHDKWKSAAEEIKSINDSSITTDQDKLRRVKLMSEIYDMLPNYFHNEIEKSFAASKFIGNWDFANFNLNNIGCEFELDGEGQVISFRSAFVDFGNSGVIGFGGKYKELSLERANTEAKPQDKKPKDYDPALKLNEEEERLVTEEIIKEITRINNDTNLSKSDKKLRSKLIEEAGNNIIGQGFKIEEEEEKIMMEEMIKICTTNSQSPSQKKLKNQVRNKAVNSILGNLIYQESPSEENSALIKSLLFKESHHIREEEAGMEIDPDSTGFLTISDLPRNTPFALLFRNVLKQKFNAAINALQLDEASDPSDFLDPDKKQPIHLKKSFYRDSEIEMAFRLSLIPDEAISYVINKWDLSEDFPQIFVMPDNIEDPERYRGEALANIFKQRKNTLTSLIPAEIINDWIANNKAKAIAAEESVKMSLFEQTDAECNISRNSISERVLPDVKCGKVSELACAIKDSIEKEKIRIIKDQHFPQTEEIKSKRELLSENIESRQGLEELPMSEKTARAISTFMKNEDQLKSDLDKLQKQLKKLEEKSTAKLILEFIKDNSARWNAEIIDSDPSYNLFDLKRISKIIKTVSNQESLKNSESSANSFNSITSLDESYSSDEVSKHSINAVIYEEFIKILDKISSPVQNIITDPETRMSPTLSLQMTGMNKEIRII